MVYPVHTLETFDFEQGRAALWSAIYLIGYHKWNLGWILVPVSFGAAWKWRSIFAKEKKEEESGFELESMDVLPRHGYSFASS